MVYRAYDPVLERDVALKCHARGFSGPPRGWIGSWAKQEHLRGYGIRGLCRCMRRDAWVSGTILPWHLSTVVAWLSN